MPSDRDPEGVTYVPTSALPDEDVYTDVGTLTVDGETFTVRRRDGDFSHHYDWVSGPNPGYGFSVSTSSAPPSRQQHEVRIREFLAAIDPDTGYL